MTSRRETSKKAVPPSYLESVRQLNAEAVPLATTSPIKLTTDWLERQTKKMARLRKMGPGSTDEKEKVPKVRLLTLLSFATHKEVRWMLFGMALAVLSGLSMPAWLLLLAKSLETSTVLESW